MRPYKRLHVDDFGYVVLDYERQACVTYLVIIHKSVFLFWEGELERKKNFIQLFTLSGQVWTLQSVSLQSEIYGANRQETEKFSTIERIIHHRIHTDPSIQ